jgi:hypothetical protein
MPRRWMANVTLLMAAALAAACAGQKVPAQAALTAADTAFAAARTEAVKYVPDQVKGIEDALAAAKDSFAKGDYQAALTAAQALPAKISDLAAAASAKKAELMKSWESLSAGLPQVVASIQSRVDILSKARKLPAGLDKAKFEGAKAGLDTIKQSWIDATAAFGAGNVTDAVAKASGVKAKAAEILGVLGMPVPPGLQ